MKRKFYLFSLIFLFGILLAYNNCSNVIFRGQNYETAIGNPMAADQVATQMAFAICSVLNRCDQVSIDQCMAGVGNLNGLGTPFGLPLSSPYNNPFSNVVNANEAGLIPANLPAADSCYTFINNLSCNSPQVLGAYNPQNANPFSGVAGMIPSQPSACSQVFNPTPTGWTQIPNTLMTSVCPAGNPSCGYVISSWSGGIADTGRNRLIMWGGGSNNYTGNELYSMDLGTQSLTRLNNPSPAQNCAETLSDGTPNSRSTYDGLIYLPGADTMLSIGGALACGGGIFSSSTWALGLGNLQWTSMEPHNGGTIHPGAGLVSDYDPNTQLVFAHDGNTFWSYNFTTNTYTQLDSSNVDFHMTGVIDPTRKLFFIMGSKTAANGGLKVYDISGSTFAIQDWTNLVTGCDGLITSTSSGGVSPGLAYDPVLDRIVGWNGGSTVYVFDPDSKSCITYSLGPGPNIAPQPAGTFGRFRYIPSLDTFVIVNDPNQNAFTLKL